LPARRSQLGTSARGGGAPTAHRGESCRFRCEWDAGAHAEFVAFGICHCDPTGCFSLADIDAARAECLEPLGLGFDVGHAQIEVDARLADFRLRYPLEDHRWVLPL